MVYILNCYEKNVIKTYRNYIFSDILATVKAIEDDGAFKEEVNEMIDEILLLIGME